LLWLAVQIDRDRRSATLWPASRRTAKRRRGRVATSAELLTIS
jgi:hypothetical protein